MSAYVSVGMVIGIIVGLLICVVLFKMANSDKKIKTQYDERQEAIRGKGYRMGFYTMIILEVALMCYKMGELSFPFGEYLVHLFVVLAGCFVICVHSIWNGAYWGINNDHKRYTIIIAVGFILNVIPIAASIAHGSLTSNGFNSIPILNVMVVTWMALIGVVALVKKIVDSRREQED